ncbi:class I SAM-dependent methyltransferase, partial [Campylobacter jejuni]|nr:methyltransferase domain-containing protein [Campylobacter jejuni]EAI3451879.1 methyltransferase domain-containing protein [Campylobacter jejuni]EAI8045334.1 class I SAM-dependent methyltransferase [Campylobacter jejuni]EAL3996580.1 methyltransferase domain-containing protein [Campylobacter jejuni]
MNSIKYISRKKCVISNTELEFLSKDTFPLFCGCVETDLKDDLICEQEWAISKYGVIQLKNLIPLELLYKNGHNSGTIGELWEEHHKKFADFIVENNPKSILEIGGGHGKLSQNCLNLLDLNWTIVEPNSKNKYENVDYIDGFFCKEIFNNKKFDTIVHSHTFEHIYDPCKFLEEISFILANGDKMIFSLPNMQKWLRNKFPNCFNFEHTILLSECVLEFLLHKYKFKILDKKYFKEHSIFYCICKDESINNEKATLKNQYEENKKLFLDMKEYYREKIVELNKVLENTTKKVYLFGAHLFSQYLVFKGLKTNKIVNILDNDLNKQGKRLYGTSFMVECPKNLKHNDNCLVILNAGI